MEDEWQHIFRFQIFGFDFKTRERALAIFWLGVRERASKWASERLFHIKTCIVNDESISHQAHNQNQWKTIVGFGLQLIYLHLYRCDYNDWRIKHWNNINVNRCIWRIAYSTFARKRKKNHSSQFYSLEGICLQNAWILVWTNHKSHWNCKINVEIKANLLSGFNELSSIEIDFFLFFAPEK